ncbi:MAG TPA: hypothetical protein VMW56_07135 [Candidatus Margulisiibacteriota bacterium]|nr:hypothetical protein [Candidatus Margulisiibacteriota bacterium]
MDLAFDSPASSARGTTWAAVRLALGVAQMNGVLAAALCLGQTGLSGATLAAVTTTGGLTMISALLFGSAFAI